MPSPNEYRQLDLDGATQVAQRAGSIGGFAKILVPVGAVAFAGYLLYQGLAPKPTTVASQEDFNSPAYPAPQLDTKRPQLNQGRIVIAATPTPEPAAPAQPPATLQAPPAPAVVPAPVAPPVAVNTDDEAAKRAAEAEAKRLAELERQRLEEEERQKWVRLRAGQLVVNSAGTGGASPSGAGQAGEAAKAEAGSGASIASEYDPNRKFLASASNSGVEISKATKNDRIDALVAQGTMIRGVLETALESDLPGMVRAVTTEDVWSFDGRRVLIPSGTRLIGEYKSGLAVGQTRVFVVWTRMLRADGVSVQLGSNGTDDLGRAGNTGIVDNHYVERFGAATLLSIVGGGTQFLSAVGQSSTAAATSTSATPTTQRQAQEIAAQQISNSLNGMANEALKNSINIAPTIYLDQGSRIMIFVRRDLDFSSLYPDPVKEELRELKREHGLSSASLSR